MPPLITTKAEDWKNDELVDSVASALAALDDAPAPEPTPDPEPEATGDTPAGEDEPTPTPEQDAGEPAGEDTPTPEEPAGADMEPAGSGGADDAPAIPDGHYRAAIHMGMSADDISALYAKDPGVALKTLAKCHEMVNAASKQLGQLGQARKKLADQPPATDPDPLTTRIADLRKDDPDDPVIDILEELVKTRQTAPEPPKETPAVGAGMPSANEVEAVSQQIQSFFKDPSMGVYADFYGRLDGPVIGDHLTPGQKANRLAMLDRAQMIMEGAELAGVEMSAADAMSYAHLEVTAPIARDVIRKEIVSKVKQRAKGVTLKPSGTKAAPVVRTGGYDKQEHLDAVAGALKETFGR